MKQISIYLIVLMTLLASVLESQSQDPYEARRDELASQLGGLIVMFAAPLVDLVQYEQEDNFYYLTGFKEPGAILLLEGIGAPFEELLFIPKRDLSEERWTGERLGPGVIAENATGIARVEPLEEFDAHLERMLKTSNLIYTLLSKEDDVAVLKEIAPQAIINDVYPQLANNRQVKTPSELKSLVKAINITVDAHRVAARSIAPGKGEYEIEALIEYEFRRNGAKGPSFPSIVGSGPYSTVLHYNRNDRTMEAGDLVVVDIGADYEGYAADITRTYPVNGKFSDRQREIYQIVLDAQKAALERVKPGATIGGSGPNSIHSAARDYIRAKGFGKYFIHGTSHHIGLEVHDVGLTSRPLESNMVITIEPGIYIPEERLGVRIEDDVLVTETGYKILSNLPKEIEQIEALMAREPIDPLH